VKFQFRLRNGKTHEFALPSDVEVRRAIIWVSKEDKEDEKPRFIIIPDDVESVEVIEDSAGANACSAQELKPITSSPLREAYSTKTEWVRKRIPKLKEEAEAPEEKEELR